MASDSEPNRTPVNIVTDSPEITSPSNLASDTPVLEVRGLTKRVRSGSRELTILDGVNLDVLQGQTVAVIGVSGSGKSTLLGLLAGLDEPTSGSVRLAGQRLEALDEDGRAALRSGEVGFVFQNFQLLAGLSALENVLLPLELTASDPVDALRDRALQVLDEVGLAERTGHFSNQLSGGEQQRVAIARAYAPSPSILFADEPTGNLDRDTGEKIVDLLMSLNQSRGTTLFIVTHDRKLAERCDRVLEIEGGVLAEVSMS